MLGFFAGEAPQAVTSTISHTKRPRSLGKFPRPSRAGQFVTKGKGIVMGQRRGFTLVELVVVILILGILAGVAAPKMFNTSAAATDNGLKQTLGIIRDAIELYAAQHGGEFPPSDNSANFQAALKDYIRGPFPKCPIGPAKNSTVLVVSGPTTTGAAEPDEGWAFNSSTGQFICNFSGMSASPPLTYDAF